MHLGHHKITTTKRHKRVQILWGYTLWMYEAGGENTLQWRHNGHSSVSNHQPHDCLLNRLFRRRSKKTPKLRVTGLCAGNSPGTGEFPAQMDSNAENVSIWWRHHGKVKFMQQCYITFFKHNHSNIFQHPLTYQLWSFFACSINNVPIVYVILSNSRREIRSSNTYFIVNVVCFR